MISGDSALGFMAGLLIAFTIMAAVWIWAAGAVSSMISEQEEQREEDRDLRSSSEAESGEK